MTRTRTCPAADAGNGKCIGAAEENMFCNGQVSFEIYRRFRFRLLFGKFYFKCMLGLKSKQPEKFATRQVSTWCSFAASVCRLKWNCNSF